MSNRAWAAAPRPVYVPAMASSCRSALAERHDDGGEVGRWVDDWRVDGERGCSLVALPVYVTTVRLVLRARARSRSTRLERGSHRPQICNDGALTTICSRTRSTTFLWRDRAGPRAPKNPI